MVPARMKAVVRDRYGPPEVMRFEDVAVPAPGAGKCSCASSRHR